MNESTRIFEESAQNVGASVMGRNMFGPIGGGAWGDEQWTGWSGDNPPTTIPCSSSNRSSSPEEITMEPDGLQTFIDDVGRVVSSTDDEHGDWTEILPSGNS